MKLYGMKIGKVLLKEWILRTEFWANTYMKKMIMKLPFNETIKTDKPHEKGLIIKDFPNYSQIILMKIQWSKVFHQQALHQFTSCQQKKNITSL